MILYVGNILSVSGGSVGFIETMTPRLASRYEIKSVSSIQSKPLRLLHMLFSVWKYRRMCEVVLIDTFSTQAFWFSYAVSRFCRFLTIPFIPIVRGGDFVNRLAKSKKECDFLFTRSYINIVPSRFLEFHFQKASYPVKYIPNFIELGKHRNESLISCQRSVMAEKHEKIMTIKNLFTRLRLLVWTIIFYFLPIIF